MTDRTEPVLDPTRNPLILPGARGTEDHGVPQSGRPDDPIDYTLEGVPVQYEPIPEQPAPIPVYIVGDNPRQLLTFRVIRLTLTGTDPVQILGQMLGRTKVTLRTVAGADTIFISDQLHTATIDAGMPVGSAAFQINAETPIFAVRNTTASDPCKVSMMVEYGVDLH